jgi:hypothetical protein
MSRERTNPMEEKITILLSKEQRDLLLKYKSSFDDHGLSRLIAVAVKIDRNYEIYLDKEQLRDLCAKIFNMSEKEENEGLAYRLEDLCDFMEDCYDELGEHEEEDEDIDYSEHSSNTGSVCVFKVALAESKKIWRKIEIREGQTLHNLHDIIFDAFDRDDEHMYSFFFPHSRQKFNPRKIYKSSEEYSHPYACEEKEMLDGEVQDASKTTIKSLDLTEKQVFYYLFDFGDEWWHEITVEKTDGVADNGEYPRIVERKGESPEQYPDPDEDW